MGRRGRKPAIEPENLPPWWTIEEKTRPDGRVDKKITDTSTGTTYKSFAKVAEFFGLDGKRIPCPIPLNVRQGGSSSGSSPTMHQNTSLAGPVVIHEAKDTASHASNLEDEGKKAKQIDIPPTDVAITKKEGSISEADGNDHSMHASKKQRISSAQKNDNEKTGYAGSNLEKEEEMAKQIYVPSPDIASNIKDEGE